MTSSPETHTPMPNNPNVIGRAFTHISVAYNGLRATISEVRAARADSRAVEADQDAEFYAALSGPVLDVVIGEPLSGADQPTRAVPMEAVRQANMPHPPTEKNPLAKQAQSQKNIRDKRAAGSYDLPTTADRGPTMDVTPRTRRQRRAATRVARELHELRDARKTQARRAKIYGSSGQVSELRTAAHNIGLALGRRRAFREGTIDAFEQERRRQEARGGFVTNEPHVMEETGHQLNQSGDTLVSALGGEIQSASRRTANARRQAAAHRARAGARRHKQHQARRRLNP